jgi:hypothetical protein
MNSYKSSTPRTAIGFVAVALTAMTIGLLVVMPAKFGTGSSEATTLATTKVVPAAPTEVAITPATIDVVGVRETSVASTARLQFTAEAQATGPTGGTSRAPR